MVGLASKADVQAQETCAPTDSTFAEFVNCANAHLKKTGYYDPLQRLYANGFYDFYKAYPDSAIAQEAFLDGVIMWLNVGEREKIESALRELDLESELWNELVPALIHSHFFKKMYGDVYIEWLQAISETLTDPEILTLVLAQLAIHYQQVGNEEKMIELYHEIDRLDSDSFYTVNIRSWLYDYEVLGEGKEAPAFEITSVGGSKFSLEEQKGKVVVLFFWSASCSICDRLIFEFKKLESEKSEEQLDVVWISLQNDGEAFVKLLEKFELKPPQFWLEEGKEHEVAKLYNIQYSPKIIVIDQNGKVAVKSTRLEELPGTISRLIDE